MDILRLWIEESGIGYKVARVPVDDYQDAIGLLIEGLTQNTKALIFNSHVEVIRAGMHHYLGIYRPEEPEFFAKLRDALMGVYRGA